MSLVTITAVQSWQTALDGDLQSRLASDLESGHVLHLERLAFRLETAEHGLLDPALSNGRAKNIGYNPSTGAVSGTGAEGERLDTLREFVSRFSRSARTLVESLFPRYAPHLQVGMTSFRPVAVEGRETSDKKNDTRLHADAFASRPNQGRRILRVFCNINPDGRPRRWLLGEPFEPYARRFAPKVRAQLPLESTLLHALHITKSRRTGYDHFMLGMHDAGKLDDGYQRNAAREPIDFPPGSTWVCFTDQVLHAALGGQHLLEQTFFVPVEAMLHPERSPLRVLERITQERLV